MILNKANAIFKYSFLNVSKINHLTGSFYVERKRYLEARPYLIKAIGQTHTFQEAVDRSDIELLLFKVDTASGDVGSALNHYIRYTAINDSVFIKTSYYTIRKSSTGATITATACGSYVWKGVTISSEKTSGKEPNDGERYASREFSYQSFSRTFTLQKDVVDTDNIQAKYENGVLHLVI